MIEKSVGSAGANRKADVETVQRILNARSDLRGRLPVPSLAFGPQSAVAPVRPLEVDSKYGQKTQAALDTALAAIWHAPMPAPDGTLHPRSVALQRLWPVAYARATGKGVRGKDAYGSGHYGATRGSRSHYGVDYVAAAGQQVLAPMSGVVRRISKPYLSGIDASILSGVEIEGSDGMHAWVWYMQPSVGIVGSIVVAGQSVIGLAKTLKNRYKKGMTDHLHIRLRDHFGVSVDPTKKLP